MQDCLTEVVGIRLATQQTDSQHHAHARMSSKPPPPLLQHGAYLGFCIDAQDIYVVPDHLYKPIQVPLMVRTHRTVMWELVNDIQLLHGDLHAVVRLAVWFGKMPKTIDAGFHFAPAEQNDMQTSMIVTYMHHLC